MPTCAGRSNRAGVNSHPIVVHHAKTNDSKGAVLTVDGVFSRRMHMGSMHIDRRMRSVGDKAQGGAMVGSIVGGELANDVSAGVVKGNGMGDSVEHDSRHGILRPAIVSRPAKI